MFVRELNSQVAVYRGELQLRVRHDPIRMERLARLVEPDPIVWPPESIVGPVSISCDGEREGEEGGRGGGGEEGEGEEGEGVVAEGGQEGEGGEEGGRGGGGGEGGRREGGGGRGGRGEW